MPDRRATAEVARPPLRTEFLCEVRVPLRPVMDIGSTPEGRRMVFMADAGTVEGPRLRGEVVPLSGGDWSRVRSDGTGALDVRLTLRTHDDALVLMTYGGRMVATAADMPYALDFAKPDDPAGAARYYFRTTPLFETGDERYAWLNGVVAVGRGRTGDGGVVYEVFAVE